MNWKFNKDTDSTELKHTSQQSLPEVESGDSNSSSPLSLVYYPEVIYMTFAKLDSGITKSSLWSESLHVRVVFLSFLAEKDENGFVSGSRSGMIRVCNVTPEQFDSAIEILSSPDPDSKSTEFEGRRISKCEGGWVVLNSDRYKLPEDTKRANRTEYMRNYMAEKRAANSNKKLTPVNSEFTSISVSESVSKSSLEECRETFLADVQSYTQYPNEMLKDFFEYWTETNHSGKKMRFQMEKTWDTHKRLARWASNNKAFSNKNQPSQQQPRYTEK